MYDTIYKEIEVRQKFDEELKAKVALEALKEEKRCRNWLSIRSKCINISGLRCWENYSIR